MSAAPLPGPEARRDYWRLLHKSMWIVTGALLAWLAVGFFRRPAASWQEQGIVLLLALVCVVPMASSWPYRKTLPALDRTPRRATVTGRLDCDTEPDADGDCSPYVLLAVTVDIDGTATESHLADIVVAESLDRFVTGSTWTVYAFQDPAAPNKDLGRTRVILGEAHDDVVRAGYDLGRFILRDSAGPGSDLLLRRFAGDPR